jgi:hypothetical protein
MTRTMRHGVAAAGIALGLAACALDVDEGVGDVDDPAVQAGPGLTLKDVWHLDGDMVHATFEEGVSVIARRGATVELVHRPALDEDGVAGVETIATVTPPGDDELEDLVRVDAIALAHDVGMFSDEEAAALRERFTASEGSFYGSIYNGWVASGCASASNNTGRAYGCWYRWPGKTVTGGKVTGRASLVSGKSKSHWLLKRLATRHNYGQNGSVRQWSPSSAVSKGKCTEINVGLSYKGVSLGAKFPVCPQKLEPDVGAKHFYTTWKGSAWRSTREAAAADVSFAPTGKSAGFRYSIHFFAIP